MFALTDVLPNAPTTTVDALALFDSCPAVEPEFMIGTWHGLELPTHHRLDGMLAASGWWGKAFLDSETVHPLLFRTSDGKALWALNPTLAFGGLGLATKIPALKRQNFTGTIAALKPAVQARGPKARLRTTRYRGVDTATMIYDQLPINDVFRRLDDSAGSESVLGAMDLRGITTPYFFVLQRDSSLPLA
ncbi:hypothetical protein NGTWS0302_04630 [Mycolicibacterium cyprinidarum]|uniref:DUF4334 domain-containing protein n=1 Tax=Mycolicibacterium cyprinidarum TaxID=2860311 RepID=A0ABQ4V754_9MYCO|nr:hypothetical protein NGTWS1803_14830 [Mycolicibacterium sp. NGTWS1803]GJF11380.1 hypothetical protein NGTWS1702_08520 [Mycolicibacterium sp. NGTWSNA01]GJF13580.1 hypothetical protein NGTWS0302_04630 [Mycolicibacterium sp. NGTWS0302]